MHVHLERLGLSEHFDCIKCADDVKNVKPDPELYLAVLDELGVRPEEALALEDSPNGITAAQAAGIFCLVVPNPLTRQLSTDGADLRLDSLADLPLAKLLLHLHEEGLRSGSVRYLGRLLSPCIDYRFGRFTRWSCTAGSSLMSSLVHTLCLRL